MAQQNISHSTFNIIHNWLTRVKEKRPELNGHSVCPFANTLPHIVCVDKLELSTFENIDSKLTVFVENTIQSSFEELQELSHKLSEQYPNYIFLPDHPDHKTYIKGIETGNQHLPLIIAQTKKELEAARRSLEKTDYYDLWDKDYLEEIKSY